MEPGIITSEGSRYSELCAAELLVMVKSAGRREVDWLSESEDPDDLNIFLVNDGEDGPPPHGDAWNRRRWGGENNQI